MDGKKLSFNFKKTSAKPQLMPSKPAANDNNIELIKSFEGQQAQLVNELEHNAATDALVIPMPDGNQKTSAALASLKRRRAVLHDEELEIETRKAVDGNAVTVAPASDNLENRAANEIIAELQGNKNGDGGSEQLVLALKKPDELTLEGAKEPTLDNYESVPVTQFGLAMLRGMGWTEPPKSTKKELPTDTIFVRPKGMGLGATIKPKPLLVQPEKAEKLELKRNAYVRILAGKHEDRYGQIIGFDDYAGRIIVRLAISNVNETFNEFLCQPVSKQEFEKYGKCINNKLYKKYKSMENEHGQIVDEASAKNTRNTSTERRSRQDKSEHDYKQSRHNAYEDRDYDRGSSYASSAAARREHSRERHARRRNDSSSDSDYKRKSSKKSRSKKTKKSKHSRGSRRRSSDSESSSSSSEKHRNRSKSHKHKSRR